MPETPSPAAPAAPPRVANRGRKVAGWLALALAVALLDQLTKHEILAYFREGENLPITSFFSLVLAFNPGAAFSFLAGAGGWQREFFSAIAIGASVLIVWLLVRHTHDKVFCFGLAMILGGAIGNLYDRLTLGKVVDFLLFHYAGWYYPAFNLADSAITLGAAALIIDSLFGHRWRRDAAVPEAGVTTGPTKQE